MSPNNSSDDLRIRLEKLGAREFEVVALSMNADRGLAALAYAEKRQVDHPIPYAIKMFDNPDWEPSGAKPILRTNQAVEVHCTHCDGHRMILVTDGPELYGETYAPCAVCNAKANTTRWIGNERRETAVL